MNKILLRDNRQLIPRWHTSRKAYKLQFPENNEQLIGNIDTDGFHLNEAIDVWSNQKTIVNAIDLFIRINQTSQYDLQQFSEVLKFLRANEEKLSPAVLNMLLPNTKLADRSDTYATQKETIRKIISKLKRQVKYFPEDALTWLDLSFYYTSIGQKQKAERSARIGYNLSPKHPYIARTFSRYLLHNDKIEEALYTLNKTGLIKHHPLIASAALSISFVFGEGKANVRSARRILENFKGNPSFLSDLAASLGTIEIQSGALKAGKRLLSQSLSHPSENAVSQCNWLYHKWGISVANYNSNSIKTIESEATNHYVNRDFSACVSKLMELYAFQPFSESSLVDAGYISLVGNRDPQFVVDLSEGRVPISAMGFSELNNLVVAKIQLNQTKNIIKEIVELRKKIPSDNNQTINTLLATVGMLEIRQGSIEEGRKLYEHAIEGFKRIKDERAASVAQVFYAEQLADIDNTAANALLVSAKKIAKKNNIYEIDSRIEVLNSDISNLKPIIPKPNYLQEVPVISHKLGLSLDEN